MAHRHRHTRTSLLSLLVHTEQAGFQQGSSTTHHLTMIQHGNVTPSHDWWQALHCYWSKAPHKVKGQCRQPMPWHALVSAGSDVAYFLFSNLSQEHGRVFAPRGTVLTSSDTRNITVKDFPLICVTLASHQQSSSLTSMISPRTGVQPVTLAGTNRSRERSTACHVNVHRVFRREQIDHAPVPTEQAPSQHRDCLSRRQTQYK